MMLAVGTAKDFFKLSETCKPATAFVILINGQFEIQLKTYAAISNAHLSRVWKQVKLSGSCLSIINGIGSTQLSDILMSYRCSDIFLTK